MRKLFCGMMTAVIILLSVTHSEVRAQGIDLTADASLLMVAETGQVLFEENSKVSMAPASITKVMTLYLVMEALEQDVIHLEDVVTVSQRAWEIGESSMFLNQGDQVTVDLLIQGLTVVSGNDAAIALAEHVSGNVEDFVKKMNDKAQELGMTQSHFQNPHGLDAANHRMSAEDIAILCSDLYTHYPEVISYYTQESLTYGGIQQENRNPLLGNVPGVDGIKTGFTDEAGYSIAVSAKKDDLRLIAVILGCETEEVRRVEAATLLEYAFTNFQAHTAATAGEVLGQIPVRRGKEDWVDFAAQQNYPIIIETGSEAEVTVILVTQADLTAPITEGQEVGHLEVSYRNQIQGQVPLIATKEIVKGNIFKIIWQSITEFFNNIVRISK